MEPSFKVKVRMDGELEPREIEVTKTQLDFINSKLVEEVGVPLFSTTFAKSKYGDCFTGMIVEVIQ